MIRSSIQTALGMFAALAVILAATGQASAQITSLSDANVQNYFYSQQGPNSPQTDPIGLPGFTPGPGGPWGVGGPLTLPALPTPQSPVVWSNNSFFGGPYASFFSDGNTPAVTSVGFIDVSPSAIGGTNVVDANVFLAMKLRNPSSLDAYHGMIFEANFLFNSALAGGIFTAPAMFVAGFTSTYAEFGGQIDFYEAGVNSAGTIGAFSPLGSINYYWLQNGGGTFATLVNATTSGGVAPTTNSFGMIAAVGRFWVAGDPAEINVNAVPEPGTILQAFSGISGLGISAFIARRRKLTV